MGLAIRYSAHEIFDFDYQSAGQVTEFDRFLTALSWGMLAVFLVHAAYTAWIFLGPLGRVLQKARYVRKKGFTGEILHERFDREEPGEWNDLDRALSKIKKSLDKKRRQYNREREELQAIVSSVKNSIVAIDTQHNVRYYNSQFAVLFKMKRKREMSERIEEIFREPSLLEAFKTAIEGGNPADLRLSLMTSRHKLPRNFNVSVSPLRNKDDNTAYGAVAIFHDVTEAQLAEKIRIDFVANASHELRTPLTSIHGYLQTLREDLAEGHTDQVDHYLNVVINNVERLKNLINDLLDLSSLESGAEIESEIEDPRLITESVLNQLDGLRSEKDILIVTKYDLDSIFVDGTKMEQVLTNLLHNALKYVPAHSKVEVIWTEHDSKTDKLIVSDDGPGIPVEHQERLFERFYRVDKGRDRSVGGTGLGLSIVKHILSKHGGEIRLISSPDKGTEFHCLFPKRKPSEASQDMNL